MQTSEVAAIREQITAEYMAARLGLYGPNSGTARHPFITARQENIGKLHQQLQAIVGDEAIALVAQTLEAVPDVPTRLDVLAALQRSFNPEEGEPLCNALQEAWQAVDQERFGDRQGPMNLESLAASAGVNLLRDRFGDEQTRKLVFAPPSPLREMPPS